MRFALLTASYVLCLLGLSAQPTELPEIGTQGVVSEIINGKREINLRQVKKLKERFGISADAFA